MFFVLKLDTNVGIILCKQRKTAESIKGRILLAELKRGTAPCFSFVYKTRDRSNRILGFG